MKSIFKKAGVVAFACVVMLTMGMSVQAAEDRLVKDGIYIGDVNIGNLTETEAEAAVEAYVEELCSKTVTLQAANGGEVQVTAGDLGLT